MAENGAELPNNQIDFKAPKHKIPDTYQYKPSIYSDGNIFRPTGDYEIDTQLKTALDRIEKESGKHKKVKKLEAKIEKEKAKRKEFKAEAKKAKAEAKEAIDKSNRDDLTGLYNQGYLKRQLETFSPNIDNSIGIIFMDLNFLKRANDNYGHKLGDILLKGTAEVFKKTFRSEDILSFINKTESNDNSESKEEILSRSGGDEFVALCPNSNDNPDFSTIFPEAVHGRLLENISEFNKNHPELPVPLSISFGVAVYDKKLDSSDIFNTLQRAETAMQAHKRSMKAGRE